MQKTRPKYLNLFEIRLPLPAFVSILHRVSGVLLFLALPLVLYLFELSLASPSSFEQFVALTGSGAVKLVLLALLWAYLHHFCAGIRFLLLDIHVGDDLAPARASSKAVLAVSLLLTVILGVQLW